MKMIPLMLCLIAGASTAAEKSATPSASYTLLRSGATVGTHPSKQACLTAREAQRVTDATTKTTGQTRYVCREDDAITVTYASSPQPVPVTGSATLSWTPPTQNTGGTALTNLAGYRISYGISPTALAQTIQVANAGASGYTVTGLTPGTWYFAVRAYASNDNESVSSNVGSKVVR